MGVFDLDSEYRQILQQHPTWTEDVHTKFYFRNKRLFTLNYEPPLQSNKSTKLDLPFDSSMCSLTESVLSTQSPISPLLHSNSCPSPSAPSSPIDPQHPLLYEVSASAVCSDTDTPPTNSLPKDYAEAAAREKRTSPLAFSCNNEKRLRCD